MASQAPHDSQIAKVRAACSIAWAWRVLGLPGAPAKNCKSPFRTEKRASFSVYTAKDGERWFDHGEGAGGDVVDFYARAKGVSVKEALAALLAMTGAEAPNRPPEAFLPQEGILWPDNLTEPTEAECQQLGALRGLSPEAFFLAGCLGTLLMGDKRGQRIWMTCDRRMRTAAMRRLDGKNLDLIDKKSASPKNAKRDWIIGTETRNPRLDALKKIVLVEGEADYYAGLQLAIESEINFKVLAILGASTKTFLSDVQSQFVGAQIVVIPHNDRSGRGEEAARFWSGIFCTWGAKDVFLQPLPIVCDDLNDFLIQRPGEGTQLLKGFHDGSTQGKTRP